MKSASNQTGIGILNKLKYSSKLYQMRIKEEHGSSLIPWKEIAEYEKYLERYAGFGEKQLKDHRVLEIGFGARPWRLISLHSLGVDIWGIDLDQPSLGLSPTRLWTILLKNGIERFLKSVVRGFLFDRVDIKSIQNELEQHGLQLKIDPSRMKVGDAAQGSHFSNDSFTFCYSEDVLEHIPPDTLPRVLDNIKTWMTSGSIIVLRPNIYTGITGGHDPDFYSHKVISGNVPEENAWRHLTDPDFKVNTYLNKLRLADYQKMFSERFEILEINHKIPGLGKDYLSGELLKKLSPEYSMEELLTNQVTFVLKVV